ncbi:MAG TPA: hypothetical protein PLD20_04645 [Blastocatellia bacterium]|nr:hypothetical protein [Blastocatellia bacterium]HMX24535.1 hypothetical protein [Blastocatellia bacterium]HMY75180.1 hypothetical protein [Blastocatellia bacterium]HMZ17196.1 hypothetical protein [Blastocatellia bacterium]HNG31889.1 hypothetical protein [Blastocatellia bacterium]
MTVSQLTICRWQGASLTETIIDKPTWEKIEAAILALNNADLNDLYLNTKAGTWLCVGGGAGRYLLTGSNGDDSFPTLVDVGGNSDQKVLLTVGGQTGDYPENWIHGLSLTLAVARNFFERGEFNSNFHW